MGCSVLHPPLEDDPLATALQGEGAGDRLLAAAFAFLSPSLHSPVQRHAVAEVAVNEAVRRALEKRSDYDPNRDVHAWLIGFVVNVCREQCRKQSREAKRFAPIQLDNLAGDVANGLERLEAAERTERLNRILTTLNGSDRELLTLVYDDDLSFPQIAAKRGGTAGAWRVAHHRLIKRIRETLVPGEEASRD
jgi:RNA polymerase sigma factor (sigma-70 family)